MLDVDALLQALDNEDNADVIDLDWRSVHALKNDMLQKLHLPRIELRALNKKLKAYRYVDEASDLRHGSYVRWIPLAGKKAGELTNGGVICHVKTDNGVRVVCRNSHHRFFQFMLGDCLVFQKVTPEEGVLLSALDYLHG